VGSVPQVYAEGENQEEANLTTTNSHTLLMIPIAKFTASG
jgi:hypothetical protein